MKFYETDIDAIFSLRELVTTFLAPRKSIFLDLIKTSALSNEASCNPYTSKEKESCNQFPIKTKRPADPKLSRWGFSSFPFSFVLIHSHLEGMSTGNTK
ncbi:hypothetical protein TNIN_145161 [Trichonephila inaurata madagascariensis]|uniref:Uncharacterized protein n=1 Tax=Trichonephila inaurata madagascariensis TaxID=2747483 RepID=A0A8X7CER6_9ARAC|nr:hypothetical protein TNIN_145161 [Trichonephila inaurata madagascariensis]